MNINCIANSNCYIIQNSFSLNILEKFKFTGQTTSDANINIEDLNANVV
jgi:hypothetical protein